MRATHIHHEILFSSKTPIKMVRGRFILYACSTGVEEDAEAQIRGKEQVYQVVNHA